MGFMKPDLAQASLAIQRCMIEIASPYNDGWTASACKKELYLLKCWLNERYDQLPQFFEEKEWEQQRLINKLKDTK